MAKRFTATEIWGEDWFLDMPNEYKLFWYYMLSNCDHAGLFKVNLSLFCRLLNIKIDSEAALEFFNLKKSRVRVVSETVWFVEDFFAYQYGDILNLNNRVHESVYKLYNKYNINILSIRGLNEVKERSRRGQNGDTEGVKDKDKDKDNTVLENQEIVFDKFLLNPKMVEVFKKHYPYYPVDEKSDFQACLQIAYLIAKQKNWTRESVLNENLQNVLDSWDKIVQFSTTDKWYSTRSISDFYREFQRIVQSMASASKPKTPQKQEEVKSAAPKLTRL